MDGYFSPSKALISVDFPKPFPWKALAELVKVFFHIGLFSIGGGYVMLPLMERELVQVRRWLTAREMANYYAIGQATPGVIAINTATFVGYRQAGVVGGIFATLGMVLPSLLCILAIAGLFQRLEHLPWVQQAFRGIRVAVAVLLVVTLWRMIRALRPTVGRMLLVALSFVAIAFLHWSPIWIVLAALLLGLLLAWYREGAA